MHSRVSPDIGGDGHFFPIVLLRWRLLTRVKIRWRQKQLVKPFFVSLDDGYINLTIADAE